MEAKQIKRLFKYRALEGGSGWPRALLLSCTEVQQLLFCLPLFFHSDNSKEEMCFGFCNSYQ